MATRTMKIGLSSTDKTNMSTDILNQVLTSAVITVTDENNNTTTYTLPQLVAAASSILTAAASRSNQIYDEVDNKYYTYGFKTNSDGELVMELTEI